MPFSTRDPTPATNPTVRLDSYAADVAIALTSDNDFVARVAREYIDANYGPGVRPLRNMVTVAFAQIDQKFAENFLDSPDRPSVDDMDAMVQYIVDACAAMEDAIASETNSNVADTLTKTYGKVKENMATLLASHGWTLKEEVYNLSVSDSFGYRETPETWRARMGSGGYLYFAATYAPAGKSGFAVYLNPLTKRIEVAAVESPVYLLSSGYVGATVFVGSRGVSSGLDGAVEFDRTELPDGEYENTAESESDLKDMKLSIKEAGAMEFVIPIRPARVADNYPGKYRGPARSFGGGASSNSFGMIGWGS